MPGAAAHAKLQSVQVLVRSSARRVVPLALLAATLAAILATSAPARAQGLSLSWQDCRAGIGADDPAYDCSANINSLDLFPSVRLAARVDSVFAMELVIDVDVLQDPMPPWWQAPDSCRQSGWSADTVRPLGCRDAWAGRGTASYQGWIPGTPGGSSRHGRLLVAAVAQPGQMTALGPDTAYSTCRVRLHESNPLNCPGCTTPACLVFNSLLIRRLPGSSIEQIFLSSPEATASTMVTLQGVGADCQAVPVKRRTWGAVKALYR